MSADRLRTAVLWKLALIALGSSHSASSNEVSRLMLIGNSMTLHAPSAAIAWSGNWGMAASTQGRDYSHVLASLLGKHQKTESITLYQENLSDFERSDVAFDFGRLKFVNAFQPDTVVIFLGDNVKLDLYGSTAFAKEYENLLQNLSNGGKRALYCVSTWWANSKIDHIISTSCAKSGGRFVDISDINALPGMRASSTGQFSNASVAAHPGDAGMRNIAERIFASMKESSQ